MVFTIVQVKLPILRADFLDHFGLKVNMSSWSLEDKNTEIAIKGITLKLTMAGISTAIPIANSLQHLLWKYPKILTLFNYMEQILHNVEHRI